MYKVHIVMTKKFITFAANNQMYIDAGIRLVTQARSLELFDTCTLFTDAYLKADPEFWSKHSEFIEKNPRGYGYWIWKPYIIKKTMESLQDGDILLYLDSAVELDIRKKEKMRELFTIVPNELILGILTPNVTYTDANWTKRDLIVYMGMDTSPTVYTKQFQGGTNMFCVCEKTRNLVNEWYTIACNYTLLNDSPSVLPNHPGFVEHRHDQSIFSLLCKKHTIPTTISLYPAVDMLRTLSGVSKLKK
jgi:hypothetical protein